MKALNRALWLMGAPMRAALIGGIRIYQATLSGAFGSQCRFYPSCSHFAQDAIAMHGAAKGSAMAAWRVLRCQPFGRGGFEPVPTGRHGVPRRYENVIPHREEAHA
jgi:putative membrane protein insertion efficiency factor